MGPRASQDLQSPSLILAPGSTLYYYISKLVRALWLVNLAGRTLLHGPLKFKVLFVAKLLRDLSPNFLNS